MVNNDFVIGIREERIYTCVCLTAICLLFKLLMIFVNALCLLLIANQN